MQHRTILIAVAAFFATAGIAQAHPTTRFLDRTTIRTHTRYELGHLVRTCTWRPGDAHVQPAVQYSKSLRTVPGWAGAAQRASRVVCAMNGGTYRTAAGADQYQPSGAVFALGQRIRGVTDAPAAGLLPTGQVVFGAGAARAVGARNIMNGLAFIVSAGHALRSHLGAPWTTPAQWSCGSRGTDGPGGCDRSCLATFQTGRVGLVEIGHASMPLAARILVRMGAVDAITFDSGGAAMLWTLEGRHNTRDRAQVGHLFGTTAGSPWRRRIPDAITIAAIRV